MSIKKEINLTALKQFFEEEKNIMFVILFGSYAKKKQNKNSDIDLAIYLNIKDKIQRAKKRNIFIAKLLHILNKKIDLVILNDIQDNFLLHDILKEGKLIYCCNKEIFFDFKINRHHQVLDFLSHYYYVNSRKNY